MTANVTKLNALRRLTMKVHAESPAPRKHKQWSVRLYDGNRLVGYVGYIDLVKAEAEFTRLAKESDATAEARRERRVRP
jgi:hypothetical protein